MNWHVIKFHFLSLIRTVCFYIYFGRICKRTPPQEQQSYNICTLYGFKNRHKSQLFQQILNQENMIDWLSAQTAEHPHCIVWVHEFFFYFGKEQIIFTICRFIGHRFGLRLTDFRLIVNLSVECTFGRENNWNYSFVLF